MSNPHANHQGEPGDTGTGSLRSQDDLRAAYDAGFEASGEGWNGEFPASVIDDAGYKMRRAQWIAHFILDAPIPTASNPRVGREQVEALIRRHVWVKPEGSGQIIGIGAAAAEIVTLIASAPSPEAGAGGGLLRQAFRFADAQDWRFLFECLPDTGEGRFWTAVLRDVLSELNTPGKLVASTGSGEKTTAGGATSPAVQAGTDCSAGRQGSPAAAIVPAAIDAEAPFYQFREIGEGQDWQFCSKAVYDSFARDPHMDTREVPASAVRPATLKATPQQSPSPTTETDPPMSVEEAKPCHWGGGNDIIWCSTCGAEYAYAKGEERPPCPRTLQTGGEVR